MLALGDKVRQQKEDHDRSVENQKLAGGAYTAPKADEVDTGDESGLPWGSLSLRHIVSTGKAKEHNSRETSPYAAASRAGCRFEVRLEGMADPGKEECPKTRAKPLEQSWPPSPRPICKRQPCLDSLEVT